MKKLNLYQLCTVVGLTFGLAVSGCQTTYDAYGNPVQTVDPAVATAAVIAAGVTGAAIANNQNRGPRAPAARAPARAPRR